MGLSATIPQNAAGIRTEPPPSVPSASWPSPAATAAEAPPLEPPGVNAGSYGFRVMPVRVLSVTPFQANSGVVVLPITTHPASQVAAVTGASSGQEAGSPEPGLSASRWEPRRVGTPRV